MSNQFNRRTIITMLGGAVVGHTSAWGHDLRPDDPSYRFEEYEAIINRRAHVRQVYEWSNIANSLIFPNIRNGLNGFQFSYDVPPREVQIVVQAYSSANAANYDDFIWEKYRMGEALAVRDPQTNQPATRNIFFGSPVADTTLTPGRQPAERNDTFSMTRVWKVCSAAGCCSSLVTNQRMLSPMRRARAVGTQIKKALKK